METIENKAEHYNSRINFYEESKKLISFPISIQLCWPFKLCETQSGDLELAIVTQQFFFLRAGERHQGYATQYVALECRLTPSILSEQLTATPKKKEIIYTSFFTHQILFPSNFISFKFYFLPVTGVTFCNSLPDTIRQANNIKGT